MKKRLTTNKILLSLLIISILFLLVAKTYAYEKSDYFDLNNKETYSIDKEGKYYKNCIDCSMEFTLCNLDNPDKRLYFTVVNKSLNQKIITQYVDNLTYERKENVLHKNGTFYDKWHSTDISNMETFINSLPINSCQDYRIKFKPSEAIDIIPIYGGYTYDEYAWFFPYSYDGIGGFYCSFDNYLFCDDCASGTNDFHQFQCNYINNSLTTPLWVNGTEITSAFENRIHRNDSDGGIFINDSSIYPFGALDPKDVNAVPLRDYIFWPNDNLDFFTSTETSFWVGAWVDINTTTDDRRRILVARDEDGGGKDFIFMQTNNGNFECLLRDNSGGNEVTISGSSDVTDDDKHLLVCTYNATDDSLRLYVDGVQESVTSNTGWAMDLDGSDKVEYDVASDPNGKWLGTIDELWVVSGQALSPTQVQELMDISHISTPVRTTFDQLDETVIINQEFSVDFNFTDVIDLVNLTYSTNESLRSNVTSGGLFRFTGTSSIDYHINVSVTDNFGNFNEDLFTLSVIGGVTITQQCPNTDIFHNDFLLCQSNATDFLNDTIVWTVNDSRVNINSSNLTAIIFDDPDLFEYNKPSCWDITVIATSPSDSSSYSFEYCINDTSPVIQNSSFSEAVEQPQNEDAVFIFEVFDNEGDNVNVYINWSVNAVFVFNDSLMNVSPGVYNFTLDSANFTDNQVISINIFADDFVLSSDLVSDNINVGGDAVQPTEVIVNVETDLSGIENSLTIVIFIIICVLLWILFFKVPVTITLLGACSATIVLCIYLINTFVNDTNLRLILIIALFTCVSLLGFVFVKDS